LNDKKAAIKSIVAFSIYKYLLLILDHNGACVSFLQTLQQENKDELIRAYPNCAIFIFNYGSDQINRCFFDL
jgi:hypothetical protein